ncbi:MAG: Fe-S cluster assembly protein SufD [Gammaproteobacteria bacterium RIFCSPHIGHO2_12_FULL_63_22]|nr:MAG: Fe-S cluster assembly protein SufD [Gammaproteobacteria bacterium RIFCSPHIGHO2_12_FULL_63_22]
MSALLDSLQASFDAMPDSAVNALGLGNLRRAAMRQAIRDGLPTQRNERWKYTGLRALSARRFVAAAAAPLLHPAALDDIPSPRLVFVNGIFDAALSKLQELPEGVTLGALSAAKALPTQDLQALFSRTFEATDEAFARVNAALASDGAVLMIAANSQVEAPLHLVFVGTPASDDIASHLRHAIVLDDGSRLTLVEHHVCVGNHRHLASHLVDVRLGKGSSLVHARIQDEDAGATLISRTDAQVGADASYQRLDLDMGGALSRLELNILLAGDRARLISGGALLAGGRRHSDTRLAVTHAARDTQCNLLWRGLAADRARVAFFGGITIQVGADGSDARLSNKNLLLSEGAEIDTQPVLQIHADEVKAAHGATVGRLDATSLFYLRSRGIPAAEARALLTQAFCREALASIGDLSLVEMLSPRLEARLATLEATS